VKGKVDLRGDRLLFDLEELDTGELPASLVQAFVGESLPVRLETGSVRVRGRVVLDGKDTLRVEPRLSFKDVSLEPKDAGGKVAGLDAAQFAKAFNEASKEVGEIDIADLKITGSLSSPRFEWGDTVKNLVLEGGKAFARKQAGKAVDRGKAEAEKLLEKVPVDAGLQDKAKDVLKGVDTKPVEGLIPGLFGGDRKKKEEGK
jgi:hypothetical protein